MKILQHQACSAQGRLSGWSWTSWLVQSWLHLVYLILLLFKSFVTYPSLPSHTSPTFVLLTLQGTAQQAGFATLLHWQLPSGDPPLPLYWRPICLNRNKINLVVQCKSQSVSQWFIVSDLDIHSYWISCVFVFLHLCIWQSKISFLISLDSWFFENIAPVGYFRHFITVYLCICIIVFV